MSLGRDGRPLRAWGTKHGASFIRPPDSWHMHDAHHHHHPSNILGFVAAVFLVPLRPSIKIFLSSRTTRVSLGVSFFLPPSSPPSLRSSLPPLPFMLAEPARVGVFVTSWPPGAAPSRSPASAATASATSASPGTRCPGRRTGPTRRTSPRRSRSRREEVFFCCALVPWSLDFSFACARERS